MNDGIPQQRYIKSLDGVRAVAIILVMAFHAGIIHFGWMGVQLFFVLSGYLITGILWKEKFRDTAIAGKLKNFWARRSLRIFPLYFGFLIGITIIYILTAFPGYFPKYAFYLFTYTYNYTRLFPGWEGNPLFTHLWSLSIEEQFYLFYPLILFFLKPRMFKWFLVICILITPFTRFLLFDYYTGKASAYTAADAVYWNTLSHLDAFYLGGLIPVMRLETKIKKPYILLALTFIVAFVAGLVNYLYTDTPIHFVRDFGYSHNNYQNNEHIWKYSVLDLVFASLILCLTSIHIKYTTPLRGFFSNSILARIGKVSYGMYIFHWAVFVYLFSKFNPGHSFWISVLLFVPYVAMVYLVAEISFRFYESKFLLLKDRFFR